MEHIEQICSLCSTLFFNYICSIVILNILEVIAIFKKQKMFNLAVNSLTIWSSDSIGFLVGFAIIFWYKTSHYVSFKIN